MQISVHGWHVVDCAIYSAHQSYLDEVVTGQYLSKSLVLSLMFSYTNALFSLAVTFNT